MTTVKEIYSLLDKTAPFSMAESWDNSGLIVGNASGACIAEKNVTKVLTALDITKQVAYEAAESGADLVISHHPVIFSPLKNLSDDHPAVILAKNGISAICMHTNFDLAENGLNKYLCRILGLEPSEGVPLDYDEDKPIGCVCELTHEMSCRKLAELVKLRLGCQVVRYGNSSDSILKVGVCSGSGGSFLGGAIRNGCQALITGDVKHHDFIDAQNQGISVIDAGHFHTERIFCRFICELLEDSFPELSVTQAACCTDPCSYI